MEMEGNQKQSEDIENYEDAITYTDDKSIGDVSFDEEDKVLTFLPRLKSKFDLDGSF